MLKRDLYYERIPTKSLRDDVRYLGNILGRVIKNQEGQKFFDLVEKIRLLSKANIANKNHRDPFKKILNEVKKLSPNSLFKLTRAFNHFMNFYNLAESIDASRTLDLYENVKQDKKFQNIFIEEIFENFFKNKKKSNNKIYNIAKSFAQLRSTDIVYDLYTGTGTIALYLAKYCAKVIGIESVSEAIDSAKLNAEINMIKNASFELGDMKDCFNDDFISRYGKADVVITDPPRNGMHKDVVKQLLKLEPKKIVYISCNSSTQARDLEFMKTKYEVVMSQAVDMFPQTHHVENIVLLSKS